MIFLSARAHVAMHHIDSICRVKKLGKKTLSVHNGEDQTKGKILLYRFIHCVGFWVALFSLGCFNVDYLFLVLQKDLDKD